MVIDAFDEEDALFKAGAGVVSIEESKESLKRNGTCAAFRVDSYAFDIQEPKTSLEEQVDKLIKTVNQVKQVSRWEKNFVYGLKRHLKTNHSLSKRQMAKMQELYRRMILR